MLATNHKTCCSHWEANTRPSVCHSKALPVRLLWVLVTTKVYEIKEIAHLEIAKSHVFLLMQISYPYIVWNNFPKFQENCASSF